MVQFESDGGTKIEAQEVKEGECAIKPENPEKEGFDFDNWYYQETVYDFDNIVKEDIIIQAKWKPKEDTVICEVRFNSNGGSSIEMIEAAKGSRITPPIAPKKEGYIFKGWFIGEEKFDFETAIEKNVELTAKWVEKSNSIKTNSDKNNNKSFDNSFTNSDNGSITTSSDNISIQSSFNEIDNVVYDYVGTWYLKGYADVYIKIKRIKYSEEDVTMEIVGTNLCSSHYELYHLLQPSAPNADENSFTIRYKYFKEDLGKYGIKLTGTSISISKNGKSYTFVKSRGKKDKYDYFNTMYKSALGTWYLYNNPNSSIKIYTASKANNDYNADCYGISISNDTLTVSNTKGTKKFYKTKKTVKVEGIKINKNTLTIEIGEAETLLATINPSDAYDKKVTWSSSNTNVATVAYPKLEATGTIALSTKATSSGIISGIQVTAKGTGGNEKYSYTIKLYHNGSLVQVSYSNNLFYQKTAMGIYRAEITVKDSKGDIATVTKEMTLSN